MPQFEIEPAGQPARLVRARSAAEAVEQDGEQDVEVGEAAPGTGWRAVTCAGAPWGRVRARDRMRFRRD